MAARINPNKKMYPNAFIIYVLSSKFGTAVVRRLKPSRATVVGGLNGFMKFSMAVARRLKRSLECNPI